MVKTGKLDLGQALADEVAERDDDWRYAAIVAAKKGETGKVRLAVMRAVDAEVDLVWFFEDDDLRDELKKDAYKDIRETHYPGDG